MASNRKLGWKGPGGYKPGDYDFPRIVGRRDLDLCALGEHPPSSMLAEFEAYDQESSSSCVGQSIAGTFHTMEYEAFKAARQRWAAVEEFPQPSALFPYYNSRRATSGGPALFDTGTYISTAADVTRKLGICDDRDWPFSSSWLKVNRRPPFAAYMRAHSRRGGNYYRIMAIGDQRIQEVKAALSATPRLPVVVGIRVSRAFMQNGKALFDPPVPGDVIGGHAIVLTGYRETSTQTLFRFRNSWSRFWGENGYGWLSEEYVRHVHTRDFTVFMGWPRLQALLEG